MTGFFDMDRMWILFLKQTMWVLVEVMAYTMAVGSIMRIFSGY